MGAGRWPVSAKVIKVYPYLRFVTYVPFVANSRIIDRETVVRRSERNSCGLIPELHWGGRDSVEP